MSAAGFQISSVSIVFSVVRSGADQRKPRKIFPFDDVIMGQFVRDTAFLFGRLVADWCKTFQEENGLWLELTTFGSIADALLQTVMEPTLSCSGFLFINSDDEEYFGYTCIYSHSKSSIRKITFPLRRPICLYKEYHMMLSSQEFFPKKTNSV